MVAGVCAAETNKMNVDDVVDNRDDEQSFGPNDGIQEWDAGGGGADGGGAELHADASFDADDLVIGPGDEDFDEDDADDEEIWEDIEEEGSLLEGESTHWMAHKCGLGGSEFAQPIKHRGNLAPYTKMMVDLMRILGQHHTVDLSMFDEIMTWGRHWHDKHPRIWRQREMHKCHQTPCQGV